MNIGDDLLGNLANSLIGKWKGEMPQLWADRTEGSTQIGPAELTKGLRSLINGGMLDPVKLATGGALSSGALSVAMNAIETFQKFAGLVNRDGIFGIKTWKSMKSFKECPPADESRRKDLQDDALAKTLNARRNKNIIFYYIDFKEQKLPKTIAGVDTDDLVVDAWNLWQQYAKLKIVEVDEQKDANVVINSRSLGDGPGGTLGSAHVGGPSINQQLECTMDADETWTPAKFRVAICHEFGHILGLNHDNQPRQLMNPFLSEISEPQPNDVARIQTLWGKASRLGEGAVTPGEDVMGRI